MSSYKATTEDSSTDRPDMLNKLFHLKMYTFFVFYQPTHLQLATSLQKLSFKLKDEKASLQMKASGAQSSKLVQINFYDLSCQSQRTQGLLDLKVGGLETKSKIVSYCSEQGLIHLIERAAVMGLDLSNIPVILAQPHPNSDFSSFCGWNEANMTDPHRMSMHELESLAKKWIQAAQQKVDVWAVTILMQEQGRLQKLVGQNFQTMEVGLSFQEKFMSHLSLGHHVRLSKNYNERCQPAQHKTTNGLIYGWERFKNFCCLGASNMKASTGVVNINYCDDKGQQIEVLKHLREYDGSQESQVEASRVVKSDKGILSLLIANIDRFHGDKYEAQLNCKPGDGRVQIAVFEGVSKCRRLGSVGGEVVLKLQREGAIQLQIGEAVYRCWGCRELRIRQSGRIKISINKDVLEC